MEKETRLQVLTEARRNLKEKGTITILELDNPKSFFIRCFIGLWLFYWLPFNFETPTRRDMIEQGLEEEMKEAGFTSVKKISKFRGAMQVVEGIRYHQTGITNQKR